MATKKEETQEAAAASAAEGIDQVRDILFGSQMRAVDRRLAELETRLRRDQESAKKDFSKQLVSLDARLKKQGETLSERLKTEQAKRAESLKALRADMKQGLKDLDKSLSQLDDAASKSDAELRDQVLTLGKSFSADIEVLSERLTGDIDRYALELRSEKTDISSLVELYTDMARRLAGILENSGD